MKHQMQLSFQQLGSILLVILPLVSLYFLVSCTTNEPVKAVKNIPVAYVEHPEWSKNANIYEVNVRQYTPEGTFAAFEEHMPRLKEMGVDILWFMPIQPIGVKNRKGTLGSYYSIKDYKGVNPEFGNLEDFKSVVVKAHELGMKVLIDWVANHSSWDNQWIYDHPEWYKKDSLGEMIAPFDWTDVAQLDYEQQGLRDAMMDALKYWVVETDIDGYRCDVAGMVPTDFWEHARKELDNIKPVFMLAEAEVPEHHIHAFDMSYAWELHHLMNEIAKGKTGADTLDVYLAKHDTLYPKSAYRLLFTSNHDENSWNGTEYERMGDGAKTFAVLSATFPGMPLIYSGQEAALKKRLEFFEKDEIEWNDYALSGFYKTLLSLKHENQALWNGEFGGTMKKIKTSKDKSIYAFIRAKGEDKVVSILNLSGDPQSFSLKGSGYEGTYINWMDSSGSAFELKGKDKVDLGAWGFLVLVK